MPLPEHACSHRTQAYSNLRLHEVVEKLPLSQVTLGTDGEKPELHSTLQVPPLGTLMPVHVMVPLLIVGAAAVAHTLAAV